MSEITISINKKGAAPLICVAGNSKSPRFDSEQKQVMMLNTPSDQLTVDFTKTMMGFVLLNPRPLHIVMIGSACASLALFCYRHFPESRITFVVPHEDVLPVDAVVPEDKHRFKVVHADGADFIQESAVDIDVLLVDGFSYNGNVPQPHTQRFYADCSAALTEQGVIGINLDETHGLYETFLDRLGEVFGSNLAEVAANHMGNVIVFASNGVRITPSNLRSCMENIYSDLSQWNRGHA